MNRRDFLEATGFAIGATIVPMHLVSWVDELPLDVLLDANVAVGFFDPAGHRLATGIARMERAQHGMSLSKALVTYAERTGTIHKLRLASEEGEIVRLSAGTEPGADVIFSATNVNIGDRIEMPNLVMKVI